MSTPMQFVPTLPAEEVARANFYGLLARLFYAPPDAALLRNKAYARSLNNAPQPCATKNQTNVTG